MAVNDKTGEELWLDDDPHKLSWHLPPDYFEIPNGICSIPFPYPKLPFHQTTKEFKLTKETIEKSNKINKMAKGKAKKTGIVHKKDDCESKVLRVQVQLWEIESDVLSMIEEINYQLANPVELQSLDFIKGQMNVLITLRDSIKGNKPE